MSLFSIETDGRLEPHVKQEWLLTNGLGGFASSTVVGCNTRRYHGVLVAATLPPVGRIMTVNRVAEVLYLDDDREHPLELSINQFRQSIHPRGDRYLRRFQLDDTARWEYEAEGVRVVKELQVLWMQNVSVVRYTVESDRPRKVQLRLMPFVSLRDFHGERRADGSHFITRPGPKDFVVTAGSLSAAVAVDSGRFDPAPEWWYAHVYPIETERGLGDSEDLFSPGRFVVDVNGKTTVTLWIATTPAEMPDWDAELKRRRDAVAAARSDPENTPAPASAAAKSVVLQKLTRAANDFVVFRKNPDGTDGTSVIAGYPWFADWGRDTMISLPGLLLSTGRFHQARQVLGVFARYVSQGMIPNRFDDYTNEPHYNTVDASLWFIHAVFEYVRLSGDRDTFDRVLRPACQAILDGYRAGTRFNIKMDEADGLISQGDPTTQLTWMDAKTDNTVFTPRQGKAVEINALWYHALVLMGEQVLAGKVADSFRKAYWLNPFRGLADVVEGDRRDTAIRPNQIFAVSLPNSPLLPDQQQAVVEVVRRELLTPAGLRTLARSDPKYQGHYGGSPFNRDGAYHNGTVWPWLIGPFLEAYLRVNARSRPAQDQARQWIEPLIERMEEFSIGQIHEICEGDAPHQPSGCPAQAWSVAEVLRIAVELGM